MRSETIMIKSVYDHCGLMTKRKYPRVELDQRVYDALQAESKKIHKPAREIATEALKGYLPREAFVYIDGKTTRPKDQKPEGVKDQSVEKTPVPNEPPPAMSEEDQKRLAEFQKAWRKREKEIDEMFGGTTPKPAKGSRLTADEDTTIRAMYLDRTPVSYIAIEIGRSESTVRSRIKRLIKKGELAERKEMTPGDERALLASLSKECIKDTRDSGE